MGDQGIGARFPAVTDFVTVFCNTKTLRKASSPAEEYMKFALEIPHTNQTNKAYMKMKVGFHAFSCLALAGGEYSSGLSAFFPVEEGLLFCGRLGELQSRFELRKSSGN
jgi:hypothetical protein